MTSIFKNSVKNLIKLFSATGLFLLPLISLAASNDLVYTLQVPILGIKEVHSNQVMNYLIAFYKVGVYLTIAFAFGILVYGGFVYMISGGNTSTKQHGLDYIWGAVWGLLIIFGSYALLYTINPALTEPKLMQLDEAKDLLETTDKYCATNECEDLIKDGWRTAHPVNMDITSEDFENLKSYNCINPSSGEIDLNSPNAQECFNIINAGAFCDPGYIQTSCHRMNFSSDKEWERVQQNKEKIFILPKEKCGAYKGMNGTVGLCVVKLYPPQTPSK